MSSTTNATVKEAVNRTAHYRGTLVMEVIEEFQLDFKAGNVVKYLLRAGHKDPDKVIEDHEKALWYLIRKIADLKAQTSGLPVGEEELAIRAKLQPSRPAVKSEEEVNAWALSTTLNFLRDNYKDTFTNEVLTIDHYMKLRLLMGIHTRLVTKEADILSDDVLSRWYEDIMLEFFNNSTWVWPVKGTWSFTLLQDLVLFSLIRPADYALLLPKFDMAHFETNQVLNRLADLSTIRKVKK